MSYKKVVLTNAMEGKIADYCAKNNIEFNQAIAYDVVLDTFKNEPITITDEDGNDVFCVGYNTGRPSISAFGITFGGTTRDENKNLTLTCPIPAGTVSAKEYVADIVNGVKANVERIEKKVATDYTKVSEARKKLLDEIEGE